MNSNTDHGEERENLLPKKSERFVNKQYKDSWATVLWVLFLAGFIVISSFSLTALKNASNQQQPTPFPGGKFYIPGSHVAGILLSSVVVSFGLSFLYFICMQRFAGKMITFSLIASIAVQFLMGAFFLYGYIKNTLRSEYLIASILFFLLGFLWVWFYNTWKLRIPFARVMLKTVTSVISKYPASITVGVTGLLVQTAWSVLWIATAVGLGQWSQMKALSDGATITMGVYILFVFYWTSEIVKNAVHITIAGLFGTYYFLGAANSQGVVEVPVLNPTWQAAKRAMTTSLGPNCYGSLIIALIELIKTGIQLARQAATDNDNIACAICLCCVECIVSMIESLLEYFNKYAFTQVAIYGKDYCSAGRDTWELVKSRGIDALINDDLIGNVLGIGCFVVGLITAGSGFLYVLLSDLPKGSAYYGVVMGVTFFIGLCEFSLLSAVIDSGVCTTFVCLAEDPLALASKQPELYQQIQTAYPQVLFF